jgi:HEAT repeat protein
VLPNLPGQGSAGSSGWVIVTLEKVAKMMKGKPGSPEAFPAYLVPQEMIVTRSRTWMSRFAAILALFLAMGITPAVHAQDQDEQSDQQLLKDFEHFVLIANYDLARAQGTTLMDRQTDPVEFVKLVESSRNVRRYEQALARSMNVAELEDLAALMDRTYRQGKLNRARDPSEVARNIALLTGTLRQQQLARERLVAAGEYAMPQLLDAVLQGQDPELRARSVKVMRNLGRQAVMPLVTALPALDPARQEIIVDVLGQIPYRTSLPFLVQLNQTTGSQKLRDATRRAVERLNGSVTARTADLYYALAEGYYDERVELTSFVGEDYQLLWNYDSGLGLVMVPILTEVFHEAMTMDMTERSLGLDASNQQTLALWLAANFSREIDSPEEYENPAYPASRREAMYYAVSAGPKIGQIVLARGLDDSDTPLARLAIASIERTAGSDSLITLGFDTEARSPLLEALRYPDRRVRYESALALGKSQPGTNFEGAQRVVPTLASAVRNAAARTAVVLTGSDREAYDGYRRMLEGDGFSVLPPATNGLDDIASPIAEAPSVDIIIISLSQDEARQAIETAKASQKLSVTPILVLASTDDYPDLEHIYGRDRLVAVRRNSISQQHLANAMQAVIVAGSGGLITASEAQDYSDRSLAVLRDLAVSGNAVLPVDDARTSLATALGEKTGRTRLEVAEVLAHIGRPEAQSAIMDAAIRNSGPEQLSLLEKVGDSAKRFGNLLPDRQVRRLLDLANDNDRSLATVAASVVGTLELPNFEIAPMILGQSGRSPTQADRR